MNRRLARDQTFDGEDLEGTGYEIGIERLFCCCSQFNAFEISVLATKNLFSSHCVEASDEENAVECCLFTVYLVIRTHQI